jgi:hypothetical protein
MRKKPLLIAVCIVAIVVFAALLLSNSANTKYERSIARNFGNQEEENALTTAESTNYSAIVSLDRFHGSSDPEAYLHPGTYLAYTYANFIDSQVLNYYETRYDNLQGKGNPKQIELTYEANATTRTQFRVYNTPAPKGATWHNNTIVISAPDGSALTKTSGNMKFYYRNQSTYQIAEWEYDFNFHDCYVVEMKLSYTENYAPTAAFFSDVYQIVVLDQNFEPVLIGLESMKAAA